MSLFASLPLIFGFLLFFIIYHNIGSEKILSRIRIAFLTSTLISSLFVALLTECLSAFSLITFTGLLISWALAIAALAFYWFYKHIPVKIISEVVKEVSAAIKGHWQLWIVTVFLFISFIIALIYPPNNYDSMTYHLGRVAHWIQNKNISYYQTHVIRQLVYQPFAEWIILHVQLLSGTDVFANTIQLFFLASSLSVVTLITKEVGGTAQQQLTSALIAVIVPMVIIQSNTTQNDIVVAFFILSFVFLAIRTLKQTKTSLIFLSGIALGLAWLTKGTAYLFTALFTLWYVLILLKDYRQPLIHILKKAAILAIIPLIAILINSGFYFRNKFLTSSALGDATKITANEGFEAKQIALVTIKNILNHFPVTDHLKEVVVQKAANFDIDANDPRYNFITIEWMKSGFYFHEDYVQNFIQTILIILAGIAFLFKRRLYTQRINYYTLFVFTIFATSILYCVLLKWQPWSNRLQTPLFLLFSVFLAIELSHTKKWMQAICFAAMLGFGIASLLWSTNHPVLPVSHSVIKNSRNSYIYKDGDLECKDYVEKNPFTKIGIYIGGDSWDYPYYRLLANTTTGTRRTIKHVMVNNESAIYLDNFVPDAVLSIDTVTSKYTIYGKDYYKARVFKNGNAIFIPR